MLESGSDDPVIEVAADGTFTALNQAARVVLGADSGPDLMVRVNAVDRSRLRACLLDLKPCDFRLEAASTIWWWARPHRMTDSRLHLQLTDVTSRYTAEEFSEKHVTGQVLSALDEINDAFVIYDNEGRLVLCNERFRELYAYSKEDARTGVHFRDLGILDVQRGNVIISDGEGTDGYLERKTEYRRKLSGSFEVLLADGRWIRTRDRRMPDGGFVSIQTDITDLKYHANILLLSKEKAEQAVRAEQEVNAQLGQFAYAVSHDLREPLRMIISYLDLLERRYGNGFEAEAREFMDYARDGARRMNDLILDLLAYTRVGQSNVTQLVNTHRILANVEANLSLVMAEAGATLNVPAFVPDTHGREGEFISLFQNLIGNAVKYRAPNRPPEITLTADRSGDRVHFRIADNGIGIAPEYHHRIFQIFQRLQRREETTGTGIGLALCKKIVEGHAGKISVESTPLQGSSFIFDLPAA